MGRERFRWQFVPSPTLHGSSLLVGARLPEFADENRSQSNCCIDLNKISGGQPTVAWRAEKVASDYASPVVCGECTYYISKAGILSCVDIGSGELLYSKRLGTHCWSTPVVVADLIYFFGKDGKTQVIRTKESPLSAILRERLASQGVKVVPLPVSSRVHPMAPQQIVLASELLAMAAD